MAEYFLSSHEETLALGEEMSQLIHPQSLICFFGDLGAGKTTFIKGLARGFGIEAASVCSPTFQYLNIYQGTRKIELFHFDLYRLKNAEEFLSMGFDEYLANSGVTCIEWAERIRSIIPKQAITISMAHREDGGRICEISL